MPTPIRTVLVDDHSVFRTGVRAELAQNADTTGIDVVGEARSVPEAVRTIVQEKPDVVVLDVHMPHGGGLEVLLESKRQLGEDAPSFLALSVSDSAEDVIRLIRAGARGYITKNTDGNELIDSIRRVHTGDAVFSPMLAGYVLDAFTHGEPDEAATPVATTADSAPDDAVALPENPSQEILDSLTPREQEVLRLLARGYSYKEMAERLYISTKTVETHVSNILRKTQHTNRYGLSRWAVDNQLG